jgi:hypothetical protein
MLERLKASSQLPGQSGFVLFIMAAAVSDFYLPSSQKPLHLEPDANDKLELQLSLTPKIL